ncbi:T9SS type A sorting domain-containing protein [Aquimarina aggregata]|uniref:T9SS type A sorting domain-containing protein n=1 Tax=Aquimarina aggregata TaxID=1642818 RepID=UPI00248FCAC1|nr:T9SS type A sorting domain-containing protein [Aquimarina aggregata]
MKSLRFIPVLNKAFIPSKSFCLLATFLCASIALFSQTQQHDWQRTNPGGGGWFGCVGASKNGIVLVGSDLSGAYRSKNGGQTWDPIGASRGLKDTHIGGMGFHRKNGNIMFLGSGGIYKTENGGDSWKNVLNTGYVSDIEFATDKPWIGYAAWHKAWNSKNAQIYKTTNTGNSWSKVSINLPTTRIIKLVVNPKNANELYALVGSSRFACSEANLYKSTNGGKNWSNITKNTNFDGFPDIIDIALNPKKPNILYISTAKGNCNNKHWFDGRDGRLFKSTNGGNTWSKLQNKSGQIFINANNTEKITLIASRTLAEWNDQSGVYTSLDAGNTFSKTSNVNQWGSTFHGEIQGTYATVKDGYSRTIGEDLSNPDNLYWANSQWVLGSKDSGKLFKVLHAKEVTKDHWQSTGVDNVNMVDIDINEVDKNIIYTSWYDIGVWRSLDRGKTWESCNNGKYGWRGGKGGNSFSVISDPQRSNVVWTILTSGQKSETPTYLLKSNNRGEKNSWIESNKGLPNKRLSGLSLNKKSPKNTRTLYVTAEGDVYKSIDDGANWSKVYDCNGCRFTAVDQFNGNIVYAGGEAGMKRSNDSGKSWKDISHSEMKGKPNIDIWNFNQYTGVYDIKTDPNHKNWIFVTATGQNKGLYKSIDQGNNWTKLITDDYMRKVAIAPQNSNTIYATSSSAIHSGGYKNNSNGILFSNNGGQTWKKQNKGMAYQFAMAVDIDHSNKPKVFVGSPGTGFQMADVPSFINETNITLNGIFNIQNHSNGQNIIAPTWANHNARMYDSLSATDQQWEFKHLGNNQHQIINIKTRRFLEVSAAKCGNNSNVNTWTSGGANHQKWYITKKGNNHYLRPVHCQNFALDKSISTNGNVKLWSYNTENENQKWKIVPVNNKILEYKNEIKIYPNPAHDFIKINNLTKGDQVRIYDILGTLISKKHIQHPNQEISISNFPSGMYIVSVFGKPNHYLIIE